jgi:protein involved in polysaccharide export with SLBB domain
MKKSQLIILLIPILLATGLIQYSKIHGQMLLPQHQMPNYIDPAQFKDQSDRRAQSLQTSPIPLKTDLEKREVRIKGPSRIETMYATFSAEIKGATDISQEIVEQYGYSVFSSTNQNANLFSSPVGDSYILGPGDELVIRIWGKLENTMYQRIGDDGNIFLGKLGPAQLNGLSLREARRVITKIFEKDYTNISLSITVGTLRSIPIFVLGNVDRPGAYNVNSLATLIQALYISGGPTKEGSLRKIELRRRNGSNKTIDLYDYILNGNNKQDPKLVANDVIYVPTIGDVVKIDGGIKIPAIFEIKKTDNLHSLITTYSGGLSGNSYFDNITLERTIKGVRQLKTISVDGSVKALKSIALENGDSITIPFSNSKQANEIQVLGHVKSPGSFGISTGLTGDNKSKQSTLQDAIKQADGFMEEANLESIYISRLQADQTRKDIFINFVSNPNFVLDPNDIITVRHKERYISVTGAVKQSGKYSIESVSLLSDIIERAKGFEENAYLDTIHISRLNSDLTRSNLFVNYNETPTFNIQPYDTITVSFAKDYLGNQGVSIQGEVYRPNIYNYSASGTLKDLLLLAGVKESSELSNVEIYRKVFSTTLKSSEEKFIKIDANTLLKTG